MARDTLNQKCEDERQGFRNQQSRRIKKEERASSRKSNEQKKYMQRETIRYRVKKPKPILLHCYLHKIGV